MNQNIEKIEKICREAEEMSMSTDWLSAEKFFSEARVLFDEIAGNVELEESRRKFEAYLDRFTKRYDAHKQRKALLSEAEEICGRIESCVGANDRETVEIVEELTKKWFDERLSQIPKEYLEILQTRFDKAVKTFFETKRRIDDEIERNRARARALEELCKKAEAIASANEFNKDSYRQIKNLKDEWDSLYFEFPGSEPLLTRLINAINLFKQKDAEERKKISEAQEAEKQALLKALQDMKSILAEEDMRKSLPRVREIKMLLRDTHPTNNNAKKILNECLSLISNFYNKLREKFEEEDWARWEHYTYKLDLCLSAEELLKEEDYFVRAKRLNELRKEWKEIGPVPRQKSEEIWNRFNSACEKVHEECKQFFDKLEIQRQESLAKKMPICEEIEKIAATDDWENVADKIVELRKAFFAIPNAHRDKEEEMRNRIRSACDAFFARRKEHYNQLHKIQNENKKAKLELIEEAAKINSLPIDAAIRKTKELRAKWKEIGRASPRDDRKLWETFNSTIESFFKGLDEEKTRNSESRRKICAEMKSFAEECSGEISPENILTRLKSFKEEWRSVRGRGLKEDEKALEDEFHSLISKIEELYKEKLRISQLRKKESVARKNQILRKIKEMALQAPVSPDAISSIRTEWDMAGEPEPDISAQLNKSFEMALSALSEGKLEYFNNLSASEAKTIAEKRRLCVELEKITGISSSNAGASSEDGGSQNAVSLDMLNELKFALESNVTLGRKKTDFREAEERVRDIEAAWSKLDSYPSDEDEKLRARFNDILKKFKNNRKSPRR